MKRLLPLLLLILFSLFLPLTSTQAQDLPPDGLPTPQIVAIAGNSQNALGCPDYLKNPYQLPFS